MKKKNRFRTKILLFGVKILVLHLFFSEYDVTFLKQKFGVNYFMLSLVYFFQLKVWCNFSFKKFCAVFSLQFNTQFQFGVSY